MELYAKIHFWYGIPGRISRVDRIAVDERGVYYYLYNKAIAARDREFRRLTVTDAGYRTQLTQRRLNAVLSFINFYVFRHRGEWYLYDAYRRATYAWKGVHAIEIRTRRVDPPSLLLSPGEVW